LRAIARGLHRAVSTVSQEVARHGGREGCRSAHADQMAWDSTRRPKPCVLASRNRLASRNLVVELIRCTNDHSAMFTFAIRSRFSPPEFPNVWSAVSFCSHHASVLHGFSFLCLQCGNCLTGLAGTIQEQIVDEEWRQTQQIEESYRFPAAISRMRHVTLPRSGKTP
jgi:hypothetical protein